jgi:hypothetical protein
MRLNLHKGSSIKYKLSIDRTNPKESGVMFNTFKISNVEGNTLYMDCYVDKLKINNKDRTKDLKAVVGDRPVTLPWTIYSRRTGTVGRREIYPGKPDVMAMLREGGIYLPYFQRQEVKPGDRWNGSTTATGGCTGATYNFKNVKSVDGKNLAYFDVTEIRFLKPEDKQIGPMKMIVDLSTGLPTVVDYKVKNSETGQVSHFRQTRLP